MNRLMWAITILILCAVWFLRHPAPRSESELAPASKSDVVNRTTMKGRGPASVASVADQERYERLRAEFHLTDEKMATLVQMEQDTLKRLRETQDPEQVRKILGAHADAYEKFLLSSDAQQ